METQEPAQEIDTIKSMILDLYTNQLAIFRMLQDSKSREQILQQVLAANDTMGDRFQTPLLSNDPKQSRRTAALLKSFLIDSLSGN